LRDGTDPGHAINTNQSQGKRLERTGGLSSSLPAPPRADADERAGRGRTHKWRFCLIAMRRVMRRPTFIGRLAGRLRAGRGDWMGGGGGGSEIFAGPSRSLVSLFQFGSDPLQPSLPGFIPRRPPPPLPRSLLGCARARERGEIYKAEPGISSRPEAKKDRLASLNLEHLRRRGCLNLNVLT